jgi:VanZ family protein
MPIKQKTIIIISWISVLLWMVLIFCLSAQAAEQSKMLSGGLTSYVIEIARTVAPWINFDAEQLQHLIRKTAHFSAYLVLSILIINAQKKSGLRGVKVIYLALSICVLYAVSDEAHQLYVSGRSAQITDVLIDSAGATLGSVLYRIFSR